MTFKAYLKLSVMTGAVGLMAAPATAQQAAQPAGGTLPQVEVIQKKAAPAAKKKAAPQQAASPAPQPPPVQPDYADQAPQLENSPYGAAASGGAAARAAEGPISPINAKSVLPDNLQDFSGAASRITSSDLDEQRPANTHEALARVPGVITVTDDGAARHSGIGLRGSPFRRSRKVLVMEDGVPINFSTYLDSSTHYTPPIERIESIEVMRGPIVNYGPLNNHGVINFRNLSPFGANETVIKAGIGHTEGSDRDINNFRHIHTRQNLGNVGVVASYSGADTGGAWDVEDLGYNDFYGAIGFKGTNQDLTISGGFFRQRDTYDEDNFDEDEQAAFFRYGRNKKKGNEDGYFAAACCYDLSSYNADYYRLQIAHNYYVDKDTTISTRLFGNDHERARFYPAEAGDGDVPATYDRDDIYMEGRDRRYRNYGADSRVELANRPFLGGLRQDFQAGVRYEEHFFKNQNRVNFDSTGTTGVVLDFDNKGAPDGLADKLEAKSFAAFAQTAIHITPTFTLTPGVRLESYEIDFKSEDYSGSADYTHVLPMLAFSWNAANRTTVYGGYHRGLTPHIIRDVLDDADDFVAPDEEIGDNFELGVRTTAVRGLTLDMAYFHNRIDNYQFGESFQSQSGDRVFSSLDEVSINGFEIYSRLDSKPFTGGPWNFFGEAVYTYADAEIEKGINEDGDSVAGNRVPESVRHFANLTLGVEHKIGWDASVTWTHRGAYHTDADNTPYAEGGLVPDVWLLSARSNLKVTEQLSLFVAGQNLTDEFYISDRSDGMKPGQGRTVMGGFTLKFD
ncbi:TonB-dependent receptor [Hyphomicrobium sp. LHD-15]|uniref:TonB-dependent receptor family protein n=1 Tax=Hyphomicrobium sp. LHD-15 TaxID=3072142 RepID=UPI00280FB433|nr:TonB-dependent receptor [Hyphomicrobium sp. LHD-15]MDQ8697674.1 TonB-dependent receptor [Hyphomicrobium sp. LHD-15]